MILKRKPECVSHTCQKIRCIESEVLIFFFSWKLCFYVWKFKALYQKPFQVNTTTADPEDLQVKVAEYDISQTNEVMGTPSQKSLKLLIALSNLNKHVKWVYSIQYGDKTGHIRQPLTFVNLYLQAKKYQGIFNLFWEYNWFKNSAV